MGIDYELWKQTTMSVGVLGGIVGFFRSLEQRKDAAFAEVMTRLCDPDSAVLRAGAARQLPSFHRYRRFILAHRPYRAQALALAIDGLKIEQPRFVRQALVDALQMMIVAAREEQSVRLDHATLDELTMMGFDFERVELTRASLRNSGLEGAHFAGANLWCAVFQGSNLKDADFTAAKLWDADFSNTNLDGTKLLTKNINGKTNFAASTLRGALVSSEVRDLCQKQGCDLSQARVQ